MLSPPDPGTHAKWEEVEEEEESGGGCTRLRTEEWGSWSRTKKGNGDARANIETVMYTDGQKARGKRRSEGKRKEASRQVGKERRKSNHR